jgi:hypothetical protein
MNAEILKKYDIVFLKDSEGDKFPDGNTPLSSYLSIWLDTDDIDDFLVDINACLNGGFDNIVQPAYYYDTLRGFYGELTPDNLLLYGKNRANLISIPLNDFKEILLAWKEFLLL